MCFRPADASAGPNKCPHCGKAIQAMGGMVLKNCPFCKGDIIRPEEKKTDVNISIRMMADCVQDKTDTIALVSADSDLLPPLEFIQSQYPEKHIKVYFPPSNYSNDLKDNMLHHRSRPVLMIANPYRFRQAVMPDEVTDGEKRYTIPEKWKLREG